MASPTSLVSSSASSTLLSSSLASSSCILPKEKLVSIDLPFYFKDHSKALDTLGGIEKISNHLENNSKLIPLHLRPGDPTSHAIHSDVLETSTLLLRIRRKKSALKKNEFQATIVGHIHRTYVFRGMADFQYLPSRSRMQSRDNPKENLKNYLFTKPNHPLDMVPPLFSRIDIPQQYHFKDSSLAKKIIKGSDKNGNELPIMNDSLALISFYSKQPLPQAPTQFLNDCVAEAHQRIRNLLVEKFNQKPIWTRLKVNENLTFEETRIARLYLPEIAFSYINGPWRQCWVKYGYNPREHNDSSIYQIVELRNRNMNRYRHHPTLSRQVLQTDSSSTTIPFRRKAATNAALRKATVLNDDVVTSKETTTITTTTTTMNDSKENVANNRTETGNESDLYGIKYDIFGIFQLCEFSGEIGQVISECRKMKRCHSNYGWYPAQLFYYIRNKHKLAYLTRSGSTNQSLINTLEKSIEHMIDDLNCFNKHGDDEFKSSGDVNEDVTDDVNEDVTDDVHEEKEDGNDSLFFNCVEMTDDLMDDAVDDEVNDIFEQDNDTVDDEDFQEEKMITTLPQRFDNEVKQEMKDVHVQSTQENRDQPQERFHGRTWSIEMEL